jgi:menaquinone-9 beta-reductase
MIVEKSLMAQQTMQYDVIVVGASIAGCTAATLFARRGLRVALVERSINPNHFKKLCTHCINGSALPVMEELGLLSKLEEAGAVPAHMDIWTRYGWALGNDEPHGINVRRETLDPMLRELAACTEGVDFMPGWSAQGLIQSGERFTGVELVKSSTRGGEPQRHVLTAKMIVGADGRQSRIAELAGIKPIEHRNDRFGYFAQYRGLNHHKENYSQFWLLEPGVAYSFPNDDGVTVLAYMGHQDELETFKQDIEGNLIRVFSQLPNAPDLSEAEQISPVMGQVDYPFYSRQEVRPGLALIGDAAVCSDPLWGIGCAWAFNSAAWLVEEAADALRQNETALDRALQRYIAKHRRLLFSHQFHINNFATRKDLLIIEKIMFRAAPVSPHLAKMMHRYASRTIGFFQYGSPLNFMRAIWAIATARRSPATT